MIGGDEGAAPGETLARLFPVALPRASGSPALGARMRESVEDFQVEELPGFDASGSGEHLLLTIEKRGMNTAFAAKRLAEWAGVGDVGIGYAGMKDRHAVTRQRFSVHLPRRVAPDLASLQSADLRVLESHWHSRKLPRGALAGNRFAIVLRGVQGDPAQVDARLQRIVTEGVPNYYGEQRFGRDGDNLAHALAMFQGRRVRREQRGILLSSARSALFNRVLATRVSDGSWNQALEGEVWMLDGSRSVFGPEPLDAALAQRVAAFDIHPSGPLWGRGPLRTAAAAAELETAAIHGDLPTALANGLERAGLAQERRALRLRPVELSWSWLDAAPSSGASGAGAALELRFVLPPGAYATVVLAELGDVVDVMRA